MPKLVKLSLRIALTIGLLALAVSWIDMSGIAEIAAEAVPIWIGVATVLFFAIIVLEAVQFGTVARAFDSPIGFRLALQVAMIGRFFALFTPGMVGTDVYRVVAIRRHATGLRAAVHIAGVSRIISLAALLPVMIAGLPQLWQFTPAPQFVGYMAVMMSAMLVIAGLAIFETWPDRLQRWSDTRLVREITAGAAAFRYAACKSGDSARLWMSAIGQHVIRVLALAAIGRGFAIEVGILAYFAIVPVSLLIAMVPITVGSWGLRELTLVAGLGLAGASASASLLTSVTFGLIGTIFALISGVLLLIPSLRLPESEE